MMPFYKCHTILGSQHFLPPLSPLSEEQFMRKMEMKDFKGGVERRTIKKLA
jgi:hypothetical protein